MNSNLTTNILVEYDTLSPNVTSLSKLEASFEKQIAPNAGVTFGKSIKHLIIEENNSSTWTTKPFNKIPLHMVISSTSNSVFGIDFQMGIRLRSTKS